MYQALKCKRCTYNERTQFKTILCATAGHNNLVPLPVLQGAVCGGPNASKRMTDTLCTYILIDQAELEASHYDEHLHLVTINLFSSPAGQVERSPSTIVPDIWITVSLSHQISHYIQMTRPAARDMKKEGECKTAKSSCDFVATNVLMPGS